MILDTGRLLAKCTSAAKVKAKHRLLVADRKKRQELKAFRIPLCKGIRKARERPRNRQAGARRSRRPSQFRHARNLPAGFPIASRQLTLMIAKDFHLIR